MRAHPGAGGVVAGLLGEHSKQAARPAAVAQHKHSQIRGCRPTAFHRYFSSHTPNTAELIGLGEKRPDNVDCQGLPASLCFRSLPRPACPFWVALPLGIVTPHSPHTSRRHIISSETVTAMHMAYNLQGMW